MRSARTSDSFSKHPRSQYNHNVNEKGLKIPAGIYLGIVVDNQDPGRQGRVKVQIMKFYGTFEPGIDSSTNLDPDKYLGAMWCRTMMPMGGTTPPAEGPNGQVSQNSYGFAGQPPSLNNEVVVAFSGDTHSGIVLGVLPEVGRMEGTTGPGLTRQTAGGETTIGQEVSKTSETNDEKPDEHPMAERLRSQGLDQDRLRGQHYSSPTRDPYSRVGGMSTPSGHSIVMDDGNFEDGEHLGMRMRSAGGAQILMDDVHGMTYINNREANVWMEMDRFGNFDIYSGSSVNIATGGDLNFHAGGNINMQASSTVNIQGGSGVKVAAPAGGVDIFAGNNMNLQADGNGNLSVAGGYRVSAARIDLNGPAADPANKPESQQLVGNTNVTEGIGSRVPEAEPWGGHTDTSKLDPTSPTGAALQPSASAIAAGAPQTSPPDINYNGDLLQFRDHVDQSLEPELISLVEEVARRFGRPFVVTSGYRSPSYNDDVGGAKLSQHMLGRALDISGSGLSNQDRVDIVAIASSLGIRGIGVYSGGSMHFDIREGGRAAWGDTYGFGSWPAYADSALRKHASGGFA